MENAHRVAFFLTHGRWPTVARHTCDNPSCCNPAHVIDGTPADNSRDRVDRGRAPYGEAHHQAKVSAADIAEIRRRFDAGERVRFISRDFPHLRQGYVWKVAHRQFRVKG